MKKSLLLGSALLVGVGAIAQSNHRQSLGKQQVQKWKHAAPIDVVEPKATKSKPASAHGTLVTSAPFTSSRNGFGMLVEETVPLSYNADLNMVAFTNRLPRAFDASVSTSYATTGITTPNSGHMITHYTTDNGTTWTGASLFTASASTVGGALGRYPSAVIANKAGNTDASKARFVGTGPCTGGSGWLANWFASRPANESGNTMTNDMKVAFTSKDSVNSVARNTYFSSYGTTTNGTDVWSGGYAYDATGAEIKAITVFKGSLDTVTGKYNWSRPLDAQLNNFLDSNYFSNTKIAFSPDGKVGYVVANGVWASDTGNASRHYQPHVWKSTDSGTSWAKVNQNYDWVKNNPEILDNLMASKNDSLWGGVKGRYPGFFDAHGGEITVDNFGRLHYVTTVVPGYSTHPDSLGYIYFQYGYTYAKTDTTDLPWVWDFTTDGNGTWNTKFISYLYTRNVKTDEAVGTNAFWTTDGSASLDYNNRIKVSRSNDGTKIFMTWTDSDTSEVRYLKLVSGDSVATYQPNRAPSIHYKGLDVTTEKLTPTYEASYLDAAEGAFYLYSTSEIVMRTATGYVIPTIYISSADGSQNATNAIDYNYISDLEILDSAIGVKQVDATTVNTVSQNFPNPFSSTSKFRVSLTAAETINVSVMNIAGQVVAGKTVRGNAGINEISLDASNLDSGIYFYTVTAGNSKVTRKMSVVK